MRLTFIRRGRELGFPLAEVRELLSLVDGGGAHLAVLAPRARSFPLRP